MMIVRSFYVSKRKEGKDHPTPDIPLPLVGSQAPFTQHVLDYIELLDQDDRLFKFSRARGWAIIRHMTGQWPHWFRAQSSCYHVNLIQSTIAEAKQRGVENLATFTHYYRGDWKYYWDELKI